jgi:hypothetical protein
MGELPSGGLDNSSNGVYLNEGRGSNSSHFAPEPAPMPSVPSDSLYSSSFKVQMRLAEVERAVGEAKREAAKTVRTVEKLVRENTKLKQDMEKMRDTHNRTIEQLSAELEEARGGRPASVILAEAGLGLGTSNTVQKEKRKRRTKLELMEARKLSKTPQDVITVQMAGEDEITEANNVIFQHIKE